MLRRIDKLSRGGCWLKIRKRHIIVSFFKICVLLCEPAHIYDTLHVWWEDKLGYGSYRLTCLRHVLYAVSYTRPESFRGIASLHHPAPSKISGIYNHVLPCLPLHDFWSSHFQYKRFTHWAIIPAPSHHLNTCSSLEPKESHAFNSW